MAYSFFHAFAAYLNGVWATITWVDCLDVALIATFLYTLLSWLQKKTSRSIFMAVAPIAFLVAVSQMLHMTLTVRLLEMGFTALAVALVVIFQEDFRRMFESLASWSRWLKDPQVAPKQRLVETLIECFATFSSTKTGALVVIKGRQSLEPHTRGGVLVNGTLSAPLLYSIFDHHSPGHDGGVTIVGNRIERLGVHLPLSRNTHAVGRMGTRHTAALGLAERCDALVLCASEETGQLSVAYLGKLQPVESTSELQEYLEKYIANVIVGETQLNRVHWADLFRKNPQRKAVSLLIAMGFWLLTAKPADPIQQTVEVPVVYRGLPTEWEARAPYPDRVRVTLAGTEGNLSALEKAKLTASLDLSRVHEGMQQMALDPDAIPTPPRIVVKRIEPSEVTVQAFPTQIVQVPVRVRWSDTDRTPASMRVEVKPKTVPVRVRRNGEPPSFVETEKVSSEELAQGRVWVTRPTAPKSGQLVDPRTPLHLSAAPTEAPAASEQ